MSFMELFKLEKDKRGIVSSSSKSKKGENMGEKEEKDPVALDLIF